MPDCKPFLPTNGFKHNLLCKVKKARHDRLKKKGGFQQVAYQKSAHVKQVLSGYLFSESAYNCCFSHGAANWSVFASS